MRLQIVPREFFAADRDKILAAATKATRKNYQVPAEAIEDILRLCGFSVCRRPLDIDFLALLEPKLWRVSLCSNIARKLKNPSSAKAVENFALAHELAHVRLHVLPIMDGQAELRHEEEANSYASVFLMPAKMIEAKPEAQQLAETSSKQKRADLLRGLAADFKVSTSAMARRMVELGGAPRPAVDGLEKIVAISPKVEAIRPNTILAKNKNERDSPVCKALTLRK